MPHRYIFLVRHGQYETAKRDDGHLTEKGKKQAQKTAEALHNIPFSNIYHSTILRAEQTAKIIAREHEAVDLRATELLRECVPSIPPHMTGLFTSNHPGTSPEEMSFCIEQMDALYATHFVPPDGDDIYELFVCHGNVIRYMMARALNVDARTVWLNMLIHNCGITSIMVDNRNMIYLVSHNEIGHMPEELRTHN